MITSTKYSRVEQIEWRLTPGEVKAALRAFVEASPLAHGKRAHQLDAEVSEDGSAVVVWRHEEGCEGATPGATGATGGGA